MRLQPRASDRLASLPVWRPLRWWLWGGGSSYGQGADGRTPDEAGRQDERTQYASKTLVMRSIFGWSSECHGLWRWRSYGYSKFPPSRQEWSGRSMTPRLQQPFATGRAGLS